MDYKQIEDIDLINQYLNNKTKEGFNEIYRRTFKPTYKYVRGRVETKQDAEDIVEETFITFLELLGSFNGKSKLSTFVIGIARNKILQFYDAIKKRPMIQVEDEEFLSFIKEEELEKTEFNYDKYRSLLDKVLDKLKPNYREVIELRFIEGNSYTETAKILGKTRNNVKLTQHRAIKKAQKIADKLLSKTDE